MEKKLYEVNVMKNNVDIDISFLAKDIIYFVHVKDARDNVQVKKFLKN